MILKFDDYNSYDSICDFLSLEDGAKAWYKKHHPDYTGENETDVEGFSSDMEEIVKFFDKKKGEYFVSFNEITDTIDVYIKRGKK